MATAAVAAAAPPKLHLHSFCLGKRDGEKKGDGG